MAKPGRYPQELRERAVRMVQEHPLDFPDVRVRQPPRVLTQHPQVDHGVAGKSPRKVDIRIEITEGERTRRPRSGGPRANSRPNG